MKHRILIEFSADTLPDDFLDQIAGRVYGHPAVDKKECTAAFVGDVLEENQRLYIDMCHAQDDAEKRWRRRCEVQSQIANDWQGRYTALLNQVSRLESFVPRQIVFMSSEDAAKDTQ